MYASIFGTFSSIFLSAFLEAITKEIKKKLQKIRTAVAEKLPKAPVRRPLISKNGPVCNAVVTLVGDKPIRLQMRIEQGSFVKKKGALSIDFRNINRTEIFLLEAAPCTTFESRWQPFCMQGFLGSVAGCLVPLKGLHKRKVLPFLKQQKLKSYCHHEARGV